MTLVHTARPSVLPSRRPVLKYPLAPTVAGSGDSHISDDEEAGAGSTKGNLASVASNRGPRRRPEAPPLHPAAAVLMDLPKVDFAHWRDRAQERLDTFAIGSDTLFDTAMRVRAVLGELLLSHQQNQQQGHRQSHVAHTQPTDPFWSPAGFVQGVSVATVGYPGPLGSWVADDCANLTGGTTVTVITDDRGRLISYELLGDAGASVAAPARLPLAVLLTEFDVLRPRTDLPEACRITLDLNWSEDTGALSIGTGIYTRVAHVTFPLGIADDYAEREL